ncbi:MAG TPA: FMN-binding protein [Solirubrobacteraceae bacterium]|jgi:uncharacterized protein with FMN-binding domain|nr:FMN-binding protein [Solirubrobacteraceae bacterium]
MKRAPLVLTGTACGLVAVIGYHTAVPQASASTSSSSAATTLDVGGTSTATTTSSSTGAASTRTTRTTSSATETAGSAVGSDVQYQYGDIELKVTMTGGRITDVTVVKEDITDPHSQQIDEYALPELRSQALSAQSAQLDGVSGASYTSAAYEQSLQSALDKLKA